MFFNVIVWSFLATWQSVTLKLFFMAICFWLLVPKPTTLYVISFFRASKKDATAIVIAEISNLKNILNYKFMPLNTVNNALEKLESHIENHTISNPKISKSDIAWHIDHSLKVINNVIIALQKSDSNTYKNNFSFLGKMFFTLGFFPRGKAKAPKYVRPPEVILKEDLITQLQEAKNYVSTIADLDKNAYFKHPLFGHINKKRVSKFLALHTNHHLKIMDDIMKK